MLCNIITFKPVACEYAHSCFSLNVSSAAQYVKKIKIAAREQMNSA